MTPEMQDGFIPEYEMDMPEQFSEDREGYEKWCDMRDAGHWLCAGECGDWKKGMPAAHNGSGPVCDECEKAARVASDYQRDHEDNFRGD